MIKASATVTITCYRDTNSITRYYKLQSSTASVPSKPNTNPPPSEWNDSEPSYTSGSTNTLYFCELSVFSDGTFSYSTVSKSSSYEAAKEAYNKAQNAQSTADTAVNHVNQIEIGGRNLIPSSEWICDVTTTDYVRNKNTQKVYIEVGETYTLSCYYNGTRVTDQSHGCAYIYAYDSNDTKIIDGDYMTTSNGIITRTVTEENISYVTVSFGVKNCVAGDVYAVKLEKGNKATDWTPAPEDIDESIVASSDEVRQEIVEQNASTIVEAEGIVSEALKTYTKTDDFNSFKEKTESSIKQNADDISLNFTKTTDTTKTINEDLQTTKETISKHFEFDKNGLTIKMGENAMKLRLDNDLIGFYKGDIDENDLTKNRFGWWDGVDFHTGNIVVEVNERAQFGNFAFVPRSDGSLMFLKVGG